MTSTVGTYAEVLTRRFTTRQNPADQPKASNLQHEKRRTQNQTQSDVNTAPFSQTTPNTTEGSPIKQNTNVNISRHNEWQQKSSGGVTMGEQRNTVTKDINKQHTKTDTQLSQRVGMNGTYNSKETPIDKVDLTWQQKLKDLESKLDRQTIEISESNRTSFLALEQKMADRIDQVLESKMLDISLVVADMVTKRLTKAMGRIVKGSHKTESSLEKPSPNTFITQDSPPTKDTPCAYSTSETTNNDTTPSQKLTNTQQMLQELANIQTPISSTSDPPHDNKIQGSETGCS